MNIRARPVAMPMILATSAVHSWLTRKGLRTFCSLNVRSAECIDPHYFAVLIGCGATTVNAYLAQDTIADRIERGLIDGTLTDAMRRYRDAIDAGAAEDHVEDGDFGDLLLSRRAELRGGGPVRAMVAEYFPGMQSRISGIGLTGIQMKLEEVHARGWRAGRTCCPSAASTRRGGRAKSTPGKRRPMHMLQTACDRASYEMWKQYSRRCRPTRRSICAICWRSSRWAARSRSKRWKASPRSASGSSRRACRWARCRPRRTRR
jgi:glutamate synthase (NADPH) large chain